MLEQEIASIIKFSLDKAGNPSPYYWEVPKHFAIPAAFFPMPEIDTAGETFKTYAMNYALFVEFFHKSSNEAYSLGLQVLTAIKGNRNLIPLIDNTGERVGENIRLDDPKLKVIDNGAAQLSLSWTSRRPYDTAEYEKMQGYDLDLFTKSAQRTISDSYAAALEAYSIPLSTGAAPGKP